MAMGQNGKPMPQLDQQSTKELNLTVLQRMDKHVEDILTTAGHVTFYEFNMSLSQWSRKDVEGSLFVVKRRTQPRFQFIVMNRRSTANLVEDLLSDFEYDVQVPYLLYRNAEQEVNGIWFYNPRECEEVAKLFSRILNAFLKIPPKPKLMSQSSNEFQELEAIPTASIVEGPLEPTSTPVAEEPFFNSPSLSQETAPSAPPARPPSASSTSRPVSGTSSHNPMPVPSPILPATSTPSGPSLSLLSQSGSLTMPAPSHTPGLQQDASDTAVGLPPATLVKPSFFISPPVSMALPPPIVPHPVHQPSHGAPFLQPFPPPAPPPSLAPSPPTFSSGITRDAVRNALSRLIQNDQFIDMIWREMHSASFK